MELLKKHGFQKLSRKRILDVGCGGGGFLKNLLKYNVNRENLYGIDISKDRILQAKEKRSGVNFFIGNAEYLPFKAGIFDIVMQFTLFTSVLDEKMKKKIAQEMLRVLKKAGLIIWYDFRYSNPLNPNVKGIGKGEITELFPNCKFEFNLITLLPWFARRIATYSLKLCQLFNKILFLRTHWLVIIKNKEGFSTLSR